MHIEVDHASNTLCSRSLCDDRSTRVLGQRVALNGTADGTQRTLAIKFVNRNQYVTREQAAGKRHTLSTQTARACLLTASYLG